MSMKFWRTGRHFTLDKEHRNTAIMHPTFIHHCLSTSHLTPDAPVLLCLNEYDLPFWCDCACGEVLCRLTHGGVGSYCHIRDLSKVIFLRRLSALA